MCRAINGRREVNQRTGTRHECRIDRDLGRGVSAKRHVSNQRTCGIVFDPINSIDAHTRQSARAGDRNSASREDGCRIAPRGARLRVGRAPRLVSNPLGKAHHNVRARDVRGVGRRLEMNGRCARGQGDNDAHSHGGRKHAAHHRNQATVEGMERACETTVRELGEDETLARIFPRLPKSNWSILGPGDDAAIVSAPDGRFVVTTDTMIHGPDFWLAWSTPHDLGWKSAASNLADIAAMGARPTALVVALAAPASTPISTLEGIADGLRDSCAALAPGCGVVGGDLSVSSVLTIAVTAFGDLDGATAITRSGAHEGDIVAVSGAIGHAARALAFLFERGVNDEGHADAGVCARLRREYPSLTEPQLAPFPPISNGVVAARAGATAMLDVSDGFVRDAGRLAKASRVAIDFDSALVDGASGGIDTDLALRGGEDHALLATFPAECTLPVGFRATGVVRAGSGVTVDGEPYDHGDGWEPYSSWTGRFG